MQPRQKSLRRQKNENPQGRRHKVLFGGDGFMGTQIHLPPKFSFSSDFGHFILKMLENIKFAYVSRKKDSEIS